MNEILISPSLLSADFSNLAQEIKDIQDGGADWLHLDVMDGLFVPNITFGWPVIKALRSCSSIFFDCHLMIAEPTRYLKKFADAGADLITIHREATRDMDSALDQIHALGIKAGISINPETPVQEIFPFLHKADLVLIMSVHPGFGGQKFIDVSFKIQALREEIKKQNLSLDIEVDGGITPETAKVVSRAGANILVAGSAIFGMKDRKEAIYNIRQAAMEG